MTGRVAEYAGAVSTPVSASRLKHMFGEKYPYIFIPAGCAAPFTISLYS